MRGGFGIAPPPAQQSWLQHVEDVVVSLLSSGSPSERTSSSFSSVSTFV